MLPADRTRAKLTLAAVLLAGQLAAVLPGLAAQEPKCDPSIPEILCPKPKPSPSPSPSPKPSPSPEPPPEPAPSPQPSSQPPEPGTVPPGGGTIPDPPSGSGGTGGGAGSEAPAPAAGGGPGDHPPDDAGGPGIAGPATPLDIPFTLSGSNTSARLVAILADLKAYGMPVRESMLRVAGPFPVAGLAWWTDDWHACRDGCARLHKGLDVFAPRGTPLIASADGVVTQVGIGELAGLYVEIEDAEGTEYFYAHLEDWPEGLHVGQRVSVGDVVGYVGNSGNAITTPTHVHFEYQPGGVPAPPKPLVDAWLDDAEQQALELLERVAQRREPRRRVDFRLVRGLDLSAGTMSPAEVDGSSAPVATRALLLVAGLQPGGPSLALARETIEEMAWDLEWERSLGDAQHEEFHFDLSLDPQVEGHADGHD